MACYLQQFGPLQEKFQWGHDSIGFCIGVTFCLVVPVYSLHRQYHQAVKDVFLMKVYTTLGIVATVLLGGDLEILKF